jgi:hypothetical protein
LNETDALLNVFATGERVTGGAEGTGLEAGILFVEHTDLTQRSAASGDFGICLR